MVCLTSVVSKETMVLRGQVQRRLVTFAVMIVLLTLGTLASAADDPAIDVAVSTDEIFVGESIDYQIQIKNVENPSAPDVSVLKEQFDVVPNGDQSRNQSSTFIFNGRTTQENEFSHIYLYRLTPKITGALTIPAIKAIIDGTELTSRSIELRVRDTEKQDLVLVEVKSDRATVYPSQPFTVTAKMHVQPLPDSDLSPLEPLRRQPPHLQVNWVDIPPGLEANEVSEWLQPLMSDSRAGFTINEINASDGSIFSRSKKAVFDFAKGRETKNGLNGEPIEYFVFELSRRFTPRKTGSYSFGPAIVKGTFVAGSQSRGGEYSGRRLIAIAPAITVEVREVPTPRPTTYSGSIGEYRLEASASPRKLRVGDPLTLTLEFARGDDAGSLELVSAPDLDAITAIADGFEIIDKAPTGRVEGNVKKFAYALRPKRAGVSIPPLVLTAFDPTSEKFTELTTDAVALDVAGVSQLTSDELVGAMPSTTTGGIQKSTAGIFQNITDPAELRDERVNLKQWVATVAGFWCLAGCMAVGITIHRRKSTDMVGQRRSKARRTALFVVAEANQLSTQGQSKEALRKIRAAFIGLVADTKNRVAEGLTTIDVEAALADASVPEADRSAIRSLLEAIENAEYGAGGAIEVASAIKSANSLIERVSPLLERSSSR